jgi:pre-rRNA-processing protein TSR1
MFKETGNGDDGGDGNLVLVASGTMSSVDPDRIILKKIVLTGIPIRVRKRFAVVKHLFHDPQDVTWFKPAELVTKRGLRGHIKESVGTHGLLKALFSGPVTQNDTVMLILYKRVFPKLPTPSTHSSNGNGNSNGNDNGNDGSLTTLLVT